MYFKRFALYWTPEPGALADFGARWLGWDSARGVFCAHMKAPFDLQELTRSPRKYGLHATLKPPFQPTPDTSPEALIDAVTTLCGTLPALRLDDLSLQGMGGFLALTPEAGRQDLERLAESLVTKLDQFRAPASDADLAKRRAVGLTARQDALLQRWGYPYVLDEFRFHVTLTGKLQTAQTEKVKAFLGPVLGPLLERIELRDVTVCGEDSEGNFHEITRCPLAG